LSILQVYIMKKLTLTPDLQIKLNRLNSRVGDLTYLGADLDTYADKKFVAIVGTRKPTPYGKIMTEKLAEDLARAGVVIISGLALGVDGLAHESCVRAGGRTIAVSPGGLEKIYPATNKPIADKIIANNGSIISEYTGEHQPLKIEFLERNRIIATLSDIVLIPEAAANSGSLNTAMHATAMNIPICAVPGNATSPMSVGTNHLLKNGAFAVTETGDVLKLLGVNSNSNQLELNLSGDSPAETLILQKISKGFTDTQSLIAETLLSTTEFQSTTTMLEVQGRIAQDTLGTWRLL
jgi:DNA processing protein